jgi:hypothetical protein
MSRTNDLPRLSRREWLKLGAAGVTAFSMSGWIERLAADTATHPQRKRSCILLWMNGGPSQMDTFDLKPGHANGGPFQEIQTSASGVRISEHLPKLARLADRMAIIRSMVDGDQGGRPRSRHLPDAHRASPRRPHPVPHDRLGPRQGVGVGRE